MKEGSRNSVSYLKYFLIIFLILGIVSLSIKLIRVYQTRSFRGEAFNLLILNKNASILHLGTKPNSLFILTVRNFGYKLKNKNRVETSLALKVPIDGIVVLDDSGYKIEKNYFSLDNFLSLFTKKRNNINEMDLIKIFWKINGIKNSETNAKETENIENEEVYRVLPEIFNESAIINDKTSVEIINGTGIDGVGGRMSEALKNEGFNIVSVGTNEQNESKIIVRGNGKSVVVKRLKDFFPFKVEKRQENSIADITLIFGRDNLK